MRMTSEIILLSIRCELLTITVLWKVVTGNMSKNKWGESEYTIARRWWNCCQQAGPKQPCRFVSIFVVRDMKRQNKYAVWCSSNWKGDTYIDPWEKSRTEQISNDSGQRSLIMSGLIQTSNYIQQCKPHGTTFMRIVSTVLLLCDPQLFDRDTPLLLFILIRWRLWVTLKYPRRSQIARLADNSVLEVVDMHPNCAMWCNTS